MNQLITITPQWQIYLPFQIRQTLGLTQPKKAKLTAIKNKLTISFPHSPILELAGKYHYLLSKKPLLLSKIREVIDYSAL